jgi:peptidyl-prolyl cis-trans isomerase SurA
MNKILTSLALALATLGATPRLDAQALSTDQIDKVVAVVDEDVILQSELDRSVNNILAQVTARNPSQQLPPRDVIEKQVLDRLILIKLQVDRAEGTGIRVSDAEVEQAAQTMARQNGVDISQLREQLARDGFPYDEFRKTLREELTVQHLRQRFVQQRVNVTDSEIDILLQNGGLKRGEVHLAHILVGIPENAKPEQVKAAREKAEKVVKEIKDGLDFNSAAIRYSESQQALEGGDMGWRRYDEVPSLFSDVLAGMKRGDVTPPMRGPSGFHILKLVDTREASKALVKEYHARHIMIRATELVTPEEAERSIRELRKQVAGGADFAKLAKQFSEDKATGTLGGDMGWFPLEAYGTRVAQVLGGLKNDELSEPFQTEAGWHIMQRLGDREVDRTTDVERHQAREAIKNRKAEEEYETFLRQIRAEAYIENRLTNKTVAVGS